jgi:hypothetical protein
LGDRGGVSELPHKGPSMMQCWGCYLASARWWLWHGSIADRLSWLLENLDCVHMGATQGPDSIALASLGYVLKPILKLCPGGIPNVLNIMEAEGERTCKSQSANPATPVSQGGAGAGLWGVWMGVVREGLGGICMGGSKPTEWFACLRFSARVKHHLRKSFRCHLEFVPMDTRTEHRFHVATSPTRPPPAQLAIRGVAYGAGSFCTFLNPPLRPWRF